MLVSLKPVLLQVCDLSPLSDNYHNYLIGLAVLNL